MGIQDRLRNRSHASDLRRRLVSQATGTPGPIRHRHRLQSVSAGDLMKRLILLAAIVTAACGSPAALKPTPSSQPASASPSPIASASSTTIPLGRSQTAMAYDQTHHNAVLFGGLGDQTRLGDTWTWNGTDWTHRQGLTANPDARQGAALVERFGDGIERHARNLYGFDGHRWSPRPAAGIWPPALCIPSLAGDSVRHQLVLFGGNLGTGVSPPPADTWAYAGNAWSRLSPNQSPPARYDAPMVYDTDHHVMVLFGGQGLTQGQTGPLNDTWIWDGSNWTPRQ